MKPAMTQAERDVVVFAMSQMEDLSDKDWRDHGFRRATFERAGQKIRNYMDEAVCRAPSAALTSPTPAPKGASKEAAPAGEQLYRKVRNYHGGGEIGSTFEPVTSPAPAQAPEPNSTTETDAHDFAADHPEPVKLQHMAVAEDGVLRWMSGRKIANCELYAMPDFGNAPLLYRSAQSEPRAPVLTDEQIDSLIAGIRHPDTTKEGARLHLRAALAASSQPPATGRTES